MQPNAVSSSSSFTTFNLQVMKSSTLIVLVLLLAALSTSGASRPNFFKALFAMGSREKTTGAATDMGPDSIENTLAFVFNFEIA